MFRNSFKPQHINASPDDLAGNNGIGRYLFLPGSDGRAQEIAQFFKQVEVKEHARGHHLYKGKLIWERKTIDVAALSTGMGCPSMEIILHELFHLGGKRFLRIGTAGTLQPWVKGGDLVNAQASVRDEDTTTHYAPLEVPAIASLEYTSSTLLAAEKIGLAEKLHTGVVHCKSSLYARELGAGPKTAENKLYLNLMTQLGVLASEMETASLFIQTQIYNHQLMMEESVKHKVLAGAILAVIDGSSSDTSAVNSAIELALETVKTLAFQELFN
jgi:uridine phosphorylase